MKKNNYLTNTIISFQRMPIYTDLLIDEESMLFQVDGVDDNRQNFSL